MTDHFIKLSCENCGGELEIYDDMDRFACGHCGAAFAIQRRGGTIVLKLLTEATPKAPSGADRASEPVLTRLKQEAESLTKRCEAMLSEWSERKKKAYIIGVSLLLIGVVVVRSGYGLVVGLSVMLAGIFTVSYIRRHDKKVLADARELHNKIDVLNGRIQDHSYQSSFTSPR
jgi:ribosomal protein S27E